MYPGRVAHHLLLPTLLGCAVPAVRNQPVSVSARSHNGSAVDVYLLCGDHDASWLGVVRPNEAAPLNFPPERTRCAEGLNFFLLVRKPKHGYWVGPIYLQRGWRVDLVIEKYAGLSSANLARE